MSGESRLRVKTTRTIGATALWIAACLFALDKECAAQTSATKCRYVNVATLPIALAVQQPIVEGAINKVPTKILLDTGASMSWLTRAQAQAMSLPLRHSSKRALGIGGESNVYSTRIDEMSIGPVDSKDLRLEVVWEEKGTRPYGAGAGADFLFQSDIEIALAAREVKFFRPLGCETAFLAYWDAGASVVPLVMPTASDRRPVFRVDVNGEAMRAIIDTGASRSIIDLRAAARVGVTPESPGVVSAGTGVGVGRHEAAIWTAQFDTLVIGSEMLRRPTIAIMDMGRAALLDADKIRTREFLRDEPEVFLGSDFLQAYRVLFAISQRKLYFSYTGAASTKEGNPAPRQGAGETAR